MNAPAYLTYYILVSSIAILVVALAGIRAAIFQAGWNDAQRTSTWQTASALFVVWFVLAAVLALAGVFRGAAERLPTIEFGIIVPVIVGLVLLWRSPAALRLLDATPQSWLIGIQFYRVLGLIFLLLNAQGRLPAVFAQPAGAGDVAVGLTAPLVAYGYARGVAGRQALVRAFNIVGLLDLAVALTTGFLSSPSPLQLLSLQAPNELISAFPLVMVPVFAVPLAVLLHVASLIKLHRETTSPLATAQAHI
jgi:hypothetical protein